MAEIDKSLPNVKQSINIPSPDELEVELQEEQQDPDQPIDIYLWITAQGRCGYRK